jgi:autotransporter adhesin
MKSKMILMAVLVAASTVQAAQAETFSDRNMSSNGGNKTGVHFAEGTVAGQSPAMLDEMVLQKTDKGLAVYVDPSNKQSSDFTKVTELASTDYVDQKTANLKDGVDGINGVDGVDGKDGKDGESVKGDKGDKGENGTNGKDVDPEALKGIFNNQSATNNRVSALDNRLTNLEADVRDNREIASAGIASALAVSGIPQAIRNGGNLVGVGVGSFDGQEAVAVGISHRSDNGNWNTKASVGFTSQGAAISAGIGREF